MDEDIVKKLITTDELPYVWQCIKDGFYTKPQTDVLIAEAEARGISIEVVDELPEVGDTRKIYLVKKTEELGGEEIEETNVYDEYIYIIDSETTPVLAHYELIGTTEIDLTNYITFDDVDDDTIKSEDHVLKVNTEKIATKESLDTHVNNTTIHVTEEDKTKLDGIEEGAEVNVQSDYEEEDSTKDSFILNKPTFVAYTLDEIQKFWNEGVLHNIVGTISSSANTGTFTFEVNGVEQTVDVDEDGNWYWDVPSGMTVTSLQRAFYEKTGLTSLTFNKSFDSSNLNNIAYMCIRCSSLKTVNMQYMNGSKITNMSSVFAQCSALTAVNGIENLTTPLLTNISSFMYDCSKLSYINLKNLITTNIDVTDEYTYKWFANTSVKVDYKASNWNPTIIKAYTMVNWNNVE